MTTTRTTSGPAAREPRRTTSLLAPAYRWATLGSVALIFLAAFEELAVTTVMPTVVADLDGRGLFAVAFSATLAASIVGMVAVAGWADRRGPSRPLVSAVGLFVVGLLVSGLAPTMTVFVTGRALQGLGAGGLIVALYVLVARVYAEVDRPRIFGLYAAAWVIPSLVGPTLAGAVAQVWSWHWVFLGVVVLALGALGGVLPAVRATPVEDGEVRRGTGRRLVLALVVAFGVAALDVVGQGRLRPALVLGVLVALAVVLAACRPLLPAGAVRLRRGLPAVVVLRGTAMATFTASDVYLPYLLQSQYGVAPWLSGVTLTLGAIGWAASSHVQGRMGDGLDDHVALRTGAGLLVLGVVAALVVAGLALPPALLAAAWLSTGAGMGLVTSRASSFVLAASPPAEQGTNSSAMTIADAVGSSTAIAVAGVVFAAVGGGGLGPFLGALGFASLLAVGAGLMSARTRPRGAGALG